MEITESIIIIAQNGSYHQRMNQPKEPYIEVMFLDVVKLVYIYSVL